MLGIAKVCSVNVRDMIVSMSSDWSLLNHLATKVFRVGLLLVSTLLKIQSH